MFDRIFYRMMRYGGLRRLQWVFKTEPSRFRTLTERGPTCPACAGQVTHCSDYPSRKKPFANMRVFYCTTCGFGFVPDTAEVLEQYYKSEYGRVNRGDRTAAPQEYFRDLETGYHPALIKYAARAKRQIALLKEAGAPFGRVLDYGSGPGCFLHACDAQEAHAVEPDEMSHKYLEYLGAQLHGDAASLPKAAFDTIIASHVIEHLPVEALHDTLSALVAALTPQGRLLIEVPQGGHSYLHLAGQRQDPHTLFFTGQALVEVVRAAGAQILFQKAMGGVDSPARKDPIYVPEGPPFYRTLRGSLTVVCKAAQQNDSKGGDS